MSYLNINYSTLEDAWGSNFEKKKKKKQHSSCYLYDKRNLSTSKPYKTINKANTPRAMYPDDDVDYIRYNGYKDKHKLAANMDKLSKYKLKYPYDVREEEQVTQEDVCEEEEDTEDEFDITPYSEEVFDEYIPSKHKNVKRANLVSSEVYKNPYNNINRGYANYKPSKSVRSRPQRRRKCDNNSLINYSFLSDVHEEDDHTIQWPDNLKKQVDTSFIQSSEFDNLQQKQQKPLTHLSPGKIKNNNKLKEYKFNKKTDLLADLEDVHFESDDHHHDNIDDDDDDDDEFGVYLRNNPRFNHEDVEDEYNAILQSVYEENDVNDTKATKTSKKVVLSTAPQEKIYLDFAIYTISGVLLIFILEQFIQIGMKIKKV
jgi:hypothetical protein